MEERALKMLEEHGKDKDLSREDNLSWLAFSGVNLERWINFRFDSKSGEWIRHS